MFTQLAGGALTAPSSATSSFRFGSFAPRTVSASESVTFVPKSSLEFTNRLSGSNLNKIGADIFKNGIREPIKFYEINEMKFVVDGNHRLGLAYKFGFQNVPAQRVPLPYKGFQTEQDVIRASSQFTRTQILNSPALRYFKLPQ
jgi:hypothetical protein